MNCNNKCIYYPCTRQECGEDKECIEYKDIIKEAIKVIDNCERKNKKESRFWRFWKNV